MPAPTTTHTLRHQLADPRCPQARSGKLPPERRNIGVVPPSTDLSVADFKDPRHAHHDRLPANREPVNPLGEDHVVADGDIQNLKLGGCGGRTEWIECFSDRRLTNPWRQGYVLPDCVIRKIGEKPVHVAMNPCSAEVADYGLSPDSPDDRLGA